MRKLLTALALALCAFAVALAGETSFYTLPNGMEVILKENHAVPLVSSVVVVKAGSKYENDQNNGFTHLLEHMLFNGTEKRTREEFNESIKDHGGYINAFTRQEITGYLIVMPKEFIEYRRRSSNPISSSTPSSPRPNSPRNATSWSRR